MGQKVNPVGFRIGHHYTWSSRWFATDKKYGKFLAEDMKMRKALEEKLRHAGLSKVEIERSVDRRSITLHVSRPGIVIGRGGMGLDELKRFLVKKIEIDDPAKLELHVVEVSNPELDATLVADWVAEQLVRRIPARRVMNQTVERVMTAGAKGVKISLAGRIGGAEIARRESLKKGTIPLHTLRAEIDFAKKDALTKSGFIGVKVWICKKVD
jgi:small subunit ribosomal protein S3